MCDWTKSNYASEQFRTLVSRRKHESIRLSPNGNEPIVNQYATSMFDNSWQKLNEDFRRFGEDKMKQNWGIMVSWHSKALEILDDLIEVSGMVFPVLLILMMFVIRRFRH